MFVVLAEVEVGASDDQLVTFFLVDELVGMQFADLFLELSESLVFLQDFLLEPEDFVLQFGLRFDLLLLLLLQLVFLLVDFLEVEDVLVGGAG